MELDDENVRDFDNLNDYMTNRVITQSSQLFTILDPDITDDPTNITDDPTNSNYLYKGCCNVIR